MSTTHSQEDATVRRNTVRTLLEVAAGRRELADGERFLDEQVRMHLDGLQVRGRKKWRAFLSYLRHRRARCGMRLRCERVDVEGDTATYHGCWWEPESSQPAGPVTARFRFEGARIVEIWSCRENYVPVFGRKFRITWGFLLIAFRGWLWWRLRGRDA